MYHKRIKYSILFSLLICTKVCLLNAQVGLSIRHFPKSHYQANDYLTKIGGYYSKSPIFLKAVSLKALPLIHPSSIFSPKHLPFFCKIEYKIESQYKIPIKFRLGNLQYVNELEKKQ